MNVLWMEGPQWGERRKWSSWGAVSPGSKIVIHALRQAGHEVDVCLWGDARSSEGYGIIMISVMFVRQYPYLSAMLHAIGRPLLRKDDPPGATPIIIGGHGVYQPTPLAASATRLVFGDGEAIAPDLIADIESWDDTPYVWPNQAEAHKHRGEPPSSLVMEQYDGVKYIEITRGCPYACRFCELGWNHAYSVADRGVVFDALEEHCQPGDRVHLLGAEAASWRHYRDAVQFGRERGLRMLYNSMRLDTSSRIDISTQTVRLGIEGPSERLRGWLGKPYATADIVDGLRHASERGVTGFRLFFLWDLPRTTDDDWTELWEWLNAIELPRGGRIDTKFTGWLPMPGTPMASDKKRFSAEEYAMLLQRAAHGKRVIQRGAHRRTAVHMLGVPGLTQQRLDVQCLRATDLSEIQPT